MLNIKFILLPGTSPPGPPTGFCPCTPLGASAAPRPLACRLFAVYFQNITVYFKSYWQPCPALIAQRILPIRKLKPGERRWRRELIYFFFVISILKQAGYEHFWQQQSAPDLKSRGRGFESRSGTKLKLFLGRPQFNSSAIFAHSQLACLPPVGIFSPTMLIWYLFTSI